MYNSWASGINGAETRSRLEDGRHRLRSRGDPRRAGPRVPGTRRGTRCARRSESRLAGTRRRARARGSEGLGVGGAGWREDARAGRPAHASLLPRPPPRCCVRLREGRAAGHRGPLSSAGGLCDDLAVQNPPRDRCPGNGRPSARQQAGHPHLRLRMLLEPSSLSGKVTTVNGSAGHCAPTGGLRCPGDGLRQNEVLFHAEMTGRCLQRTKPSCSWQGTPCPSPSRVRYGAAGTLPASSGPSLGGCFVPLLHGPSLEPGRVRACTRSRLQTRKCRHMSGQTHLGTVTTARKL